MRRMTAVSPLPRVGEVLFDVRDGGRTLRVSRHGRLWVLSTWVGGDCISTFQLDRADVAALVNELVCGLAETESARPYIW